MKKILSVLFVGLLIGCAGYQIDDNALSNDGAYFAGRGVYVAIHAFTPDSIDGLEKRYGEFLDATEGMETIEPELSLKLYNDVVFLIALQYNDPYGLLADLNFILEQHGAEFLKIPGENKQMIGIAPVPRSLYVSFSRGWETSKLYFKD